MYNSRFERRLTRSINILLAVSLLIVFGLVGMVSADCGGGGGPGTFASGNQFSNWEQATDPVLDDQIIQENLLFEKLQQEKLQLEKALQDKTLDAQVQQQKIAEQKIVDQKIAQEKVNQDNLLQQKDMVATTYETKIGNSGSSIYGLKVKFPKKTTSAPGSDYLSYSISPYSATVFADQKLAAAKTFAEPQTQITTAALQKACSERLGSYLCTKGKKVAF